MNRKFTTINEMIERITMNRPRNQAIKLVLIAALIVLLVSMAGPQAPVAAANAPTVNGLFYGDGDDARYTSLAQSSAGSKLYAVTEGSTLYVALVVDRSVNDNVFAEAINGNLPYMQSAGWPYLRAFDKLVGSEYMGFTLKCGATTFTWKQGYGYQNSDGSWYSGIFTGPGGGGTPPPSYTPASSIAWNLNNTNWNYKPGNTTDKKKWESPRDSTFPNDVTVIDGYPDTGQITFSTTYQWEWSMVYEWSADVSTCGANPIQISQINSHHSPSKTSSSPTDDPIPDPISLLDWGDLPSIYPTLSANNGARHYIVTTGAYLGAASPDPETNGQPSATALGDDNVGNDDEDGIVFLTPLVPGSTAQIQVTAGTAGYLSAWIDFNGDGTLTQLNLLSATGPAAVTTGTIGDTFLSAPGVYVLTIQVPTDATGVMHSRWRYTNAAGQGGNAITGLATTGEVEDYALASVGDYVWNDRNNDGIQDANEPAMAGVIVRLLDSNGNPVLDGNGNPVTTTTDPNGFYQFSGLPPADYRIQVVPPEGYAFTQQDQGGNDNLDSDINPATGQTAPFTLTQGQTRTDIDAGLIGTAAIGNYIWLDENSDGYQDAGEPGLANVQVNLYDANGALVASTYTDAQGGYLFDNLSPGTYYVDVLDGTGGQGYSLPYPGLTQTPYNLAGSDFGNQNHTGTPIPNTGFSGYQVVLGGGGENLTADFGYNANPTDCVDNPADPNCNDDTATIGDRVWIDADGDGFQDPNEAGLAGVTVTLYHDPDGNGVYDTVYATTTTDANGNYLFDGLPPAAYVVVVTPPAGYTQSGDPDYFGQPLPVGQGDNRTTTPVILGPGDVFLNADFGYQPPAAQNNSIGDKVWFDADADGVGPNGNGAAPGNDNTEYGIPGVTVALIKDTNGNGIWNIDEPIIATATTDANGDYLFPGLPDGNYLVWVNDTDNVLGDKTPTYDQNGGVIYAGSGAPTGVAANTVLGLSAAALDPGSTNAGPVSVLTQDFGYTAPGQAPTTGLIGDRVWLDINNDGVQDANEPGLEGQTVTLKDNNGNTIATTTTDENGNYYFGGLPAGTYTVVVTPPAGLTQTYDADGIGTANQSTVTIGGANPLINLDQDFGYVGTGTIGNLVWEDLNADGDVDTGENGIGGVTLDLYWDLDGDGKVDPGEPLVGSTTTANDGSYLFSGLPTDDGGGNAQFIVDVTDENGVLTGYWHSLGQAGQNDNSQTDPYPVTLTPGTPNNLTADFGYYVKPAAVGNRVWSDTDGKPATDPSGVWDGVQQSNEVGIANVEVTLTIEYPDGTITVLKTKTDSNGFYSFGNLLLDEDYNAGTTGSPAGTGLPKYTLSISTAEQSRLLTDENLEPTGVKNEESGVGTPTEIRDDSNYHNGTIGMPVQGVTDTQATNPVTNEAVIASYDFGFKGSDTTPVTLGYFRATSVAGGIRFDWTTVIETGNIGFNIYVETAAGRQPVNSEMILDQPGDSMQARDYSYEAAGASGTVFYLEDVSVFAETRLHGPFNLNEVYGERVAPDLIDWAAIAAEHAALDRRRATAEQAAAARMTAGQNATGSAIETNIGKPNKYPPIEFQVREDGIYRVTYEQVRAATGVKLYRVPAKQLALTNRGQPVPIYVSSWLFGPGEFIEFIGTGLDTFYTDTNVYRLEVNGDLNKKISVLRESPSIKGQIPSYYMETAEIERNRNYSSIAPNGDPWFDTRMFNQSAGVTEYPFDIPIDHYVPGVAPAYLTVSMWGLTGFVKNGPDHLIDVNLNGERVARAVFDINETVDLNVELANDALQPANKLVLVQSNPAWGLSPGNWSTSFVDKYGLVYPRAFVAREDRLSFTSQGDAFRITNLSRPWIVAYGQVGDTVTRLQGRLLEYEGGGYAVTFNGLPGEARYYVSTVAGLRKPAISLARAAQPITQTPADILVIAHPNFIPGLKPWLDARSANYKIRVVDVRDAYALYSGGIFDAQAIADYIRDAVPATGAKYVVLVGGDTVDYRNYLGANSMSFIPSLYAKASVYTDFAPVDPLFADINGDRVPDVAIARFPVQTPAQLQLLINKTLLYDTSTNVGTAVFAADSGFEADSDRFAAALPAGWSVSKAYVGPAGANATTARTTLLAAMNGGARLASFVGHSGSERWTFKNFFFAADAAALQNESLPMVVTQWGCYNTYYVEPKANTLGHNFLLSGMNGAAAVTGATTETSSRSEYKMGSLFMPRLMQPGMTLGTAMQQAKTELAVTDPFRTDVILGWTILGDPTLVVNPQP